MITRVNCNLMSLLYGTLTVLFCNQLTLVTVNSHLTSHHNHLSDYSVKQQDKPNDQHGSQTKQITNETINNQVHTDYTNKLLTILGIGDHVERRTRHLSAPQFMIDLYKTLADPATGSIKQPKPYQADTVWAFHHSEFHKNHLHFHFNITKDRFTGKQILEAEFHIFKLKPKRRLINQYHPKSKTQLLEVAIYQLLTNNIKGEKKLLDSRRMSLNSIGWEMFYVKPALINWIDDSSSNHGLLITVKSLSGEKMDDHLIRWVNGHYHQINKRPILVVYTVDKGHKTVVVKNNTKSDFSTRVFSELFLKYGQPSDTESSEYSGEQDDEDDDDDDDDGALTVRDKKSSNLINMALPSFSRLACSRVSLTVDLDKLTWTRFVIYPKNLAIYGCSGDCSNLIGTVPIAREATSKSDKPQTSKHAAIQSFISQQSQQLQPANVNPVSCVPTDLESLDILYFAADGTVILRQIDDLVVSQCGCQ